ncbi:hypothetical protein AKUG0414_UNKNOWN100070 (plasmid) [Apilactobacillus kunkeei]|nr:hypothetical protein AKUG0414_UNKNOWN100070 [Apilactobacillus kunkeei]
MPHNLIITVDLTNERACLLVVKMYYRNDEYKFLIPWRSNVPTSVTKQKNLVYKLPPTTHTKKGHIACLDFRKSVIVPKNFRNAYEKFNEVDDRDNKSILIIEKNLDKIIKSFKLYLEQYVYDKNKIAFSVDLDRIINITKDKERGNRF